MRPMRPSSRPCRAKIEQPEKEEQQEKPKQLEQLELVRKELYKIS
jgi:hypothetical protein